MSRRIKRRAFHQYLEHILGQEIGDAGTRVEAPAHLDRARQATLQGQTQSGHEPSRRSEP